MENHLSQRIKRTIIPVNELLESENDWSPRKLSVEAENCMSWGIISQPILIS